jgi:hypothetical protein
MPTEEGDGWVPEPGLTFWRREQLISGVRNQDRAAQMCHIFLLNNQPDALIIQIYSVIKLHMFRASSLPIIRSFILYLPHWQVSCMFLMTVSKQSQDGTSAEHTVENS